MSNYKDEKKMEEVREYWRIEHRNEYLKAINDTQRAQNKREVENWKKEIGESES